MTINPKKFLPVLARSIWSGDAGGWNHPDANEIVKWLGWLRLPETMTQQIPRLESFAARLRADRFKDVVLLGMGGSSLAPLVMASVFKPRRGFPQLHVLDSTDPANVAAVEAAVDSRRTLFIVASKSGATIEPNCFYKYFRGKLSGTNRGWARQFVAITDEGTVLHEEARAQKFRDIFIAPSDVGGRYSALSFFGLVPAACIGVPLRAFLAKAREMAARCGADVASDDNVGLQLGAAMGLAALEGKDKLTLILPRQWARFGLWIEQLIAESTGKQGKGIVPIAGEPLREVGGYGSDRFFVHLRQRGKRNAAVERYVAALRASGHLVTVIEAGGMTELGAEFFRWEFATAAAGAVLGINPFDQPDVQAAKDQTHKIIAQFVKTGKMPATPAVAREKDVCLHWAKAPTSNAQRAAPSVRTMMREFLSTVRPRDYLALLAYLPMNEQTDKTLQRVRRLLGGKLGVATTFGYGPRYLHSTGQLHKGGANNGVFIVITSEPRKDLAIPTEKFTFGQLERAQALGDVAALETAGRRVVRLHLDKGDAAAISKISSLLCVG
jgi:transaldolase/glucose-6-phosphate isomerase